MKSPHSLVLSICFLLCQAGALAAPCRAEHRDPASDVREMVSNALTGFYPYSVDLSTDRKLVARKVKSGNSFIVEAATSDGTAVLCRDTSERNQISLTWSPDGRSLAFQEPSETSEGYDFYLLDIESCKRRRLEVRASENAVAPLRFSPNGESLLIDTGPRGKEVLTHCELSNRCKRPKFSISGVSFRSQFDWSPDGRRIAVTIPGVRPVIRLLNPLGEMLREIPLENGAFPIDLDWSKDSQSLLATYPKGTGTALVRIDSATEAAVVRIFQGKQRENPMWIDSEHYLTQEISSNGTRRIFLGDQRSEREIEVAPALGESRTAVRIFDNSRALISAWTIGQAPRLFFADVAKGSVGPPMSALGNEIEKESAHKLKLEMIKDSDSSGFSSFIVRESSKATSESAAAKKLLVVITADARSYLQDPALSAMTPELMRRGWKVGGILVGAGDLAADPSASSAALVKHVEHSLNSLIVGSSIAAEQVTVLAASKFSGVAAAASFRGRNNEPGRIGTLVLISPHVLESPPEWNPPHRVLSYFGALDRSTGEAETSKSFERWFSGRSVCRVTKTLASERHTFQRLTSWASIFAAVLTESACPPAR